VSNFVVARLWEPIQPLDRGDRYEDPLDAALSAAGWGDVTGGGSQLTDHNEKGVGNRKTTFLHQCDRYGFPTPYPPQRVVPGREAKSWREGFRLRPIPVGTRPGDQTRGAARSRSRQGFGHSSRFKTNVQARCPSSPEPPR